MKSTKVKLYACKFIVVVVLIVVVNLQLLIWIDIDSSVRRFYTTFAIVLINFLAISLYFQLNAQPRILQCY